MNTKTDIAENICRLCEVVREKCPLVHCITNYVTVNDVANVILAVGASPIMADDINEAADIASIASALVLNMGTLNSRTVESMIAAGKAANAADIPVVFDPVGAGASGLRNSTAARIMENVKVSVLRGNLSEMSFMAGLEVSTKGVDSSDKDKNNDPEKVAVSAAEKFGCVAAITGAVDCISDGKRIVRIENGSAMLRLVTGTGCMTTGIIGGFAGAAEDMLTAACAGISAMGIAGEIAYERAGQSGTGSYRVAVIDALSRLDPAIISERIKIYER